MERITLDLNREEIYDLIRVLASVRKNRTFIHPDKLIVIENKLLDSLTKTLTMKGA